VRSASFLLLVVLVALSLGGPRYVTLYTETFPVEIARNPYPATKYDHALVYVKGLEWGYDLEVVTEFNVKPRRRASVDVWDDFHQRWLLRPVWIHGGETFSVPWNGQGYFEPRIYPLGTARQTAVVLHGYRVAWEDLVFPAKQYITRDDSYDHCRVWIYRREPQPTRVEVTVYAYGAWVDVWDNELGRWIMEPTYVRESPTTYVVDWDGRGLFEVRISVTGRGGITSDSVVWIGVGE